MSQARSGENGNPSRFLLSPAGKVLIRADWHRPRRGKRLSCRIRAVPAGNSASPSGFALSPLGTAVIGADWTIF